MLLRIGRDFSRRRSCMMFHPLRNSDCDLQRDQTSRCASVSRPFGPMLAVACLMTSSLLCGCASGLMTMPGATLLASRFAGDNAAKVTEEKNSSATVPKLMYLNKPGIINNAGSRLEPGNDWPVYEDGANEKDIGQYDTVREISAFCGACVLFTREFLQKVGIFDKKFFLYFEKSENSRIFESITSQFESISSWKSRLKVWQINSYTFL